MIKDLKGIHHVTAMTSSAEKKLCVFYRSFRNAFSEKNRQPRRYSYVSIVFADDKDSAGTDMTFLTFQIYQKDVTAQTVFLA